MCLGMLSHPFSMTISATSKYYWLAIVLSAKYRLVMVSATIGVLKVKVSSNADLRPEEKRLCCFHH